jgi:hypothetical protein
MIMLLIPFATRGVGAGKSRLGSVKGINADIV